MHLIIKSLVLFGLTMSLSSCAQTQDDSESLAVQQLIHEACIKNYPSSDKLRLFTEYKVALQEAVKIDQSYREDYEASIIALNFVKGQQVDLSLANSSMAKLEALCTLVKPY